MKKKKLNLEKLEVLSFVTSSPPNLYEETPNIKGGTPLGDCVIIGVVNDWSPEMVIQWMSKTPAAANSVSPYAPGAGAGAAGGGGGAVGGGGGVAAGAAGLGMAVSPAAIIGLSLLYCPDKVWKNMGDNEDAVWHAIM